MLKGISCKKVEFAIDSFIRGCSNSGLLTIGFVCKLQQLKSKKPLKKHYLFAMTKLTIRVFNNFDQKFTLAKREFTIQVDGGNLQAYGHLHKNVALKYLMKRRRSILMTKDKENVEKIFTDLPRSISIVGRNITHRYTVNWQRDGITDFEGSRFVFTLEEISVPVISVPA
ncbi:MAG: hypothetical protein M3O24_02465 [Thermoproteota archaeon]|nr:hypothetical protein [Thermoproteota archaeon]